LINLGTCGQGGSQAENEYDGADWAFHFSSPEARLTR
jgi:hypothetical protein